MWEWIGEINRWNAERYRLIQIRYEISKIWASYDSKLKLARAPGAPRHASPMLYAEIDSDTRGLSDEYDRILTDRMLRGTAAYGVPVPPPIEQSPFWQWSDYEDRELLTIEGLAHLRREIGLEREMRHKPWINWGGFAVSILSLAIAILALTNSS